MSKNGCAYCEHLTWDWLSKTLCCSNVWWMWSCVDWPSVHLRQWKSASQRRYSSWTTGTSPFHSTWTMQSRMALCWHVIWSGSANINTTLTGYVGLLYW